MKLLKRGFCITQLADDDEVLKVLEDSGEIRITEGKAIYVNDSGDDYYF